MQWNWPRTNDAKRLSLIGNQFIKTLHIINADIPLTSPSQLSLAPAQCLDSRAHNVKMQEEVKLVKMRKKNLSTTEKLKLLVSRNSSSCYAMLCRRPQYPSSTPTSIFTVLCLPCNYDSFYVGPGAKHRQWSEFCRNFELLAMNSRDERRASSRKKWQLISPTIHHQLENI